MDTPQIENWHAHVYFDAATRDAAWALREHGTVPPLVDDPENAAAVRSGEVIAPADRDWLEIYAECIAEAQHPSLLKAAE